MRVQLTNAGAALLDANTGPIQVSTYKLGSDYGYVPDPTDTNIHGSLVYSGAPSQYFVVNANVVKYTVVIDYSLGPFSFGEIGLFTSTGVLFALATGDDLLNKIPVTATGGNAIRADIYLSMVNQNYEMWLDYADTNNDFRMAVLQSVDQLPPVSQASPNTYIIGSGVTGQSAYMAYTDRTGLWNFDAYAYAYQQAATIVACDSQSVTINNSDYVPGLSPAYFGEVIAEFSSGVNYSICRYVSSVVHGSSTTVINFDNSLMQLPIVGDKIIFFGRQALSTTIGNLPIATSSTLGAIKVGNTLTIASDGTLDVNDSALPVTSVNGMLGDVELTGADIPGLATVALTGKYTDLIGAPAPYTLPKASTTALGGVKMPSDGNLTVAGDGTIDLGFAPVKTVNGGTPDSSGNVVVTIPPPVGLVSPATVASGSNLNTYTTTGLFFCPNANAASIQNSPEATTGWTLDVESFSTTGNTGDCIQRLMVADGIYLRRYTSSSNTWSTWIKTLTSGSIPIATTAQLGTVSVGTGLNVTAGGALSTVIQTINGGAATNVVITPLSIGAAKLGMDSRVPFYQSPTGDWFTAGKWDATANHIIQAYTGKTALDTLTSLNANGMATIDTSYNGNNPNLTGYASMYQEGAVYEVIATGTTNLDGINTWNVGDFAVAVNGKWARIALTSLTPAPLLISGANTVKGGGQIASGASQTLNLTATASAAVDIIGFLTVNIEDVTVPANGNQFHGRLDLTNVNTGQDGFNFSDYVGGATLWSALSGVKGDQFTIVGTITANSTQGVSVDAYMGYFMYATGG